MIPAEIFPARGDATLNEGRAPVHLSVADTGGARRVFGFNAEVIGALE